jgi:general secretion pathway protein L
MMARRLFAFEGSGSLADLRKPFGKVADWIVRQPQLASGLKSLEFVWRRLLQAFGVLVDPLLLRFETRQRLVAMVLEDGGLAFHRVLKGQAIPLRTPNDVPVGTRWTDIELRLPNAQVLQTTIVMPAASRGFLQPIIEHRLERLTPWRPDKVRYGFRASDDADDAGNMRVAFLAVSTDVFNQALARLRSMGFEPTAVGAREGDLVDPLSLDLLGSGAARQRFLGRVAPRVWLVAMACLLFAVIATGLWESEATARRDEAAAHLLKARKLVKTATLGVGGEREHRLLAEKRPAASTMLLIDRLSRIIPSDTYLREMTASAQSVRLLGTSGNAPALIGLLEAQGFSDVRFTAPLTREKDRRDSFELTARRASNGGRP